MVKIAFWDNFLGERGTTIALFDYAYYNIKILGNESIIIYNKSSTANCEEVVNKFKKEFNVFGVNNFSEVDNILLKTKCDIIYLIKSGEYDGKISNVCKTVVHCVFSCIHPHGDVYASIAPWVNHNNGKFPFVPHIVNLPDAKENMREILNIPTDAIVYGRYGGYEQFDIPYVHNIVYNVAKNNSNIFFVFVNTKQFCDNLPNIIYLDKIIDLNEKAKFINTCDAMIWARSDGETFGLSIAEFSIKNKPVIATKVGDLAHVNFLKNKGIWYDESNLENILTNFDKDEIAKKDWNAYKLFTPERVMVLFKRIFIDN
jgi:glycosyltransferase involved in cell wall biosynthesis